MATQFTEDPIETLDDWNTVLAGGCCCTMPECPVPTKECESVSPSGNGLYLFVPDDYDAETNNVLYARLAQPITPEPPETLTRSTYGVFGLAPATEPGPEYTSQSGYVSSSANYFAEYKSPFEGSGCGGYIPHGYETGCDGSTSRTVDQWAGVWHPDGGYNVYKSSTSTTVQEDVSGTETEEFAAWSADWNDETWQEAHDQWVIDEAAFQQEYDDWIAGGEVGPEPAPDHGPEPPVKPAQFYGPCTYKRTTTSRVWYVTFDGSFWGTEEDEESPWVSYDYGSASGVYGDEVLEIPLTPQDLTDFVLGLAAAVNFDSCSLTKSDFCSSRGIEGVWSQSVRKSRFRWTIPDTHEGSYFKITWDEVFFPADESTPTVVNTDKTWTWDGPGDPDDDDTWKSGWYELDPPETPGEVRVVNVRFECYAGPYGSRPQTTGEEYAP